VLGEAMKIILAFMLIGSVKAEGCEFQGAYWSEMFVENVEVSADELNQYLMQSQQESKKSE
jgi:hypothetical protein